jgi:hypothetical protein
VLILDSATCKSPTGWIAVRSFVQGGNKNET